MKGTLRLRLNVMLYAICWEEQLIGSKKNRSFKN